MSWTFYLQDTDSGLFLSNPGDTNDVKLEEQDFSINQTWYWGEAGNRLLCGTGRVMVGEYGCMINMSDWPYPSDKQIFNVEKDDSYITMSHQGKFVANVGDKQVGLSEENPFTWKQVPTSQGYYWKEVGSYQEFPEEGVIGSGEGGANYYFGRGYRDGTLHMGMGCKRSSGMGQSLDRFLAYHDESLMSEMPFYLQHEETGLYLTCSTEQFDKMLKLKPLEFTPAQIFKWTNKQDDGRYMLSNATYNLITCAQCPDGPAMQTNNYSTPPPSHMLFTLFKQKGGTLIIANDVETQTVFGMKEMYGQQMATLGSAREEGIQFKWKAVPIEQGYSWCAMDSSELPKNAVCAGNDVYVGRGQVNGRLYVGTACDGKRQIAKMPDIKNPYDSNEEMVKEVESEAFSVLCAEEGAEWVEYKHGTPPSAYAVDWSVFPKHAVVAGMNSSESVVFVGRVAMDGQMVTGFYRPSYSNTKITVFHQGKVQEVEGFEALVINKESIKVETEKRRVDENTSYFGEDNVAKQVNNEKFSILCIDGEQKWVDYQKEELPAGAVVAGVFNDNVYYVGRKKEDNIPGTFLPRRTMKSSDEDVPFKLHIIEAKHNWGTIEKLDEFEVLVVKPAPCKLIQKGSSAPAGYKILDINEKNFEDNWEHIKSAVKAEIKKGALQLAMRSDIS